MSRPSVLMIHTGGTLGMQLPEGTRLGFSVKRSISLGSPIESPSSQRWPTST